MNTELDVLRSVQRWANLVFTDYEIMSGRREPQVRPGGVVRMTPNVAVGGTAYVTQLKAAVTLYLWPAGVEGDPHHSEWEAKKLASTLRRAVSRGAAGSRAFRIPLWDYDGLGPEDNLPTTPTDRTLITAFTAVERSFTVQIQQDAEADDLYTVFADLRLEWVDQGDQSRFAGHLLDYVHVGPVTP